MRMPLTCSQLHVSASAFLFLCVAAAGWETTPPASPTVEIIHKETTLLFQGRGGEEGRSTCKLMPLVMGAEGKFLSPIHPRPLKFKTCIPSATKRWALRCRSSAPTPAPSRAQSCSPAAPPAHLCPREPSLPQGFGQRLLRLYLNPSLKIQTKLARHLRCLQPQLVFSWTSKLP